MAVDPFNDALAIFQGDNDAEVILMPSCVACNDIPEIDDKVIIVGLNPIRWKCNKCGCVCDFSKP